MRTYVEYYPVSHPQNFYITNFNETNANHTITTSMYLQGDNTVFSVHQCGQNCHIILENIINLQFNKTTFLHK